MEVNRMEEAARRQAALKRAMDNLSTLPTSDIEDISRGVGAIHNQKNGASESYGKMAMDTSSGGQAPLSTPIGLHNIRQVMQYQMPDRDQRAAMESVREVLIFAGETMLRVMPTSPSATRAINALLHARMEANMAISFRGQF